MAANLQVENEQVEQTAARRQPAGRRMSVLVAIASYGTAQDHFLKQVIAEYAHMDMDCRIVVLSNIDKPVEGAEVLVGLPSKDTYSLPFAHRALFIKHANDYDLFVYTEDDTRLTAANVRAFLDVQQTLRDDQIVGFMRSETGPEGERYIVSVNYYFRWLPQSVFSSGPYRFAQFSNQHSGCFIATREQLARAIASGGFTVEPRSDRYGMLETAASDIYTQCGLQRVICLSRIEDFIVPHLANKYFRKMGVPAPAFEHQVRCVSALDRKEVDEPSLFEPETKAPTFRWSKNLYRGASRDVLALIPPGARKVLSVGATTGDDEALLADGGAEVTIVPLDAAFGAALHERGFNVLRGPIDDCMARAGAGRFDAVLFADGLHLLPDPARWVQQAAGTLRPGGTIVGGVSNTSSWLWVLKDWRAGRPVARPAFEANGAHPVSPRRLRSWAKKAGLRLTQVIGCTDESPAIARLPAGWLRKWLAPRLLFQMEVLR